jgi:hypothetical protein
VLNDKKYQISGMAAPTEPSAGEDHHGPGVPGPGSSSEERQRETPKTVLHIPVEPIDEAMKRAIKADGKAVHDIALNDLDSAFNALFLICGTDHQLIRTLDAAYVYLVDETHYKHATVCGIGVGVAINVIGSLLAHAPDLPSRALSQSAAQVRAEVTARFPDAVQSSFGLEIERKGPAGNDGANVAQRREATTAPETNANETVVHGDVPSWTVEEFSRPNLGTWKRPTSYLPSSCKLSIYSESTMRSTAAYRRQSGPSSTASNPESSRRLAPSSWLSASSLTLTVCSGLTCPVRRRPGRVRRR